uniref:Uncharacterized protein n=1 Tax=Enterovibrio norvegicus TaxID=188144 RepID=A0A0H4A4Y4_9GAMM|nr:hypothetical protein [Enterovibrio norvegicus]
MESINTDTTTEGMYFVKYGKGGVLIKAKNDREVDAAAAFNGREDMSSFMGSHIKKVVSLNITDSYVTIEIENEKDLTVERKMPLQEVTFETYKSKVPTE